MSAGLVVVDGTLDADGLLDAADRAMYGTKARLGGVRVVIAATDATLDALDHWAEDGDS